MKEIRTRPKKWDIQTRQTTAFLPKQAAKVLREQAVRRQFKRKNNMPEEEQTSPYQEPVERFQTKEQRAAEISSRTAFRSGQGAGAKAIRPQIQCHKAERTRCFILCCLRRPETPQVTRAKQKFRQTQAKKQTERRRETAAAIEKHEAAQVQTDIAMLEQQVELPSLNADTQKYTEQHCTPKHRKLSAAAPKEKRPIREQLFTGRQDTIVRQRAGGKGAGTDHGQEPNSECSSRSCRKPHKRQRRPPNAQ